MRNKRTIVRTLFSALLACILPTVLRAQVATGDIVGEVTDPSNAVISSVNITAENASTGLIRKTISDASGNWTITTLPIGTYSLRAERPGLKVDGF